MPTVRIQEKNYSESIMVLKLKDGYRLEGIPPMDRPTLLLKKQAILKGIRDRRAASDQKPPSGK